MDSEKIFKICNGSRSARARVCVRACVRVCVYVMYNGAVNYKIYITRVYDSRSLG